MDEEKNEIAEEKQVSAQPVAKKSMLGLWIVIIVVILIIVGALAYWLGKNASTDDHGTATPVATDSIDLLTATVSPSATTTLTVGSTSSTTYKSSDFGFSLDLPSGYSIQEQTSYEGAYGTELSFGKNKTANVSVSNWVKLTYYKDNSSLDDLENSYKKENGSDLSDRQELNIDGQRAVSYSVGGLASGKTILSTNGTAVVKISVYPDNDETRTFVDNLAKSFKF